MKKDPHSEVDLRALAEQAMTARGLLASFSPASLQQLRAIQGPAPATPDVVDLRDLAWCSIDNEESRDLDQLSVAVPVDRTHTRVLVAIADVDALVARGTPIDDHACTNTTTVYTPGVVFPMLPERLSTDLTSLNGGVDRVAVVVDMVVDAAGRIDDSRVYRGHVRNQARLDYEAVSAWLEGVALMPSAMAEVPTLDANLRLQDQAARRLRTRRRKMGALDFDTRETRPRVEGGRVVALELTARNRARAMIEDLMIAANGVTARFLRDRGYPALRRVVREPERWDRIVAIARELGEALPDEPDAAALERFLEARRAADPTRYPDLSLAVVKLLGPGRYAVEGAEGDGHFGLAVKDYAHSTAPNRRFPDLLTHRLLKAALVKAPAPYSVEALDALGDHCTRREDDARKVERQMRKTAAALYLTSRIGETFDAIVTGAARKGTWIRTLTPPAEGRLVRGERGLDVGQQVRVRLLSVDVPLGHVDFEVAP